ncbi:MAG TPA: SDR family oxidoreductase [Ruminiclostridium sp.]|nr:SDR family oxidoreductase [Ruminiclostridium sp.]
MKKVVLITGASRGIGRAASRLFAENGWSVAINYYKSQKSAEELYEELKKYSNGTMLLKADVSDINDVRNMVETCEKQLGHIDVLINNAGIAQQKLFTDITDDDWNRMFSVDVTGVFNCCRCVLPSMIRRRSGKIINVSSIWGICGASCEVHYSAAKAAVIGLTKALAKEEGPSNIQVNCVAPGVIDTEMNGALSDSDRAALCEETPLGRFGTSEDIAKTMLFLASPAADFITGQVISPNGGFVI